MVNIAMLTEKLIVETDANLSGSTSYGEYIPNWKKYVTLAASITTQKGAVRFDADGGTQDYSDSISFFTFYRKDIQDKKAFRIKYNGLIYTINNITSIQWLPNKAMVLDCVAVLQ